MTKTTKGKAVAKASNTSLSASQMDQMAGFANKGMESVGVGDVIMPRLSILQDLSPQVSTRKPEYIEGAEVGQILNVATAEVVDDIVVIPCVYKRHNIEWKPNRGGFVNDHGEDETMLNECTRDDKGFDVHPNGNIIIPTATWYCIDLFGNQLIIPMSRTQLKPSRQWMSYATSEKLDHPEKGKFTPPLFYRSYHLSTVIRDDGDNSWFVWNVKKGKTILEMNDPDLMAAAIRFEQMLSAGEVAAGAESFGDETSGSAGGNSTKSDKDKF